MNMPGFTAGASLYKTKGHYQREVTHRVGLRGNNGVLAQLRQGEAEAQQVLNMLKFGSVQCQWVEYCEGRMPNINCGIKEVCYWWPW